MSGGACALGVHCCDVELTRSLFHRVALLPQLGDRAPVLGNSLFVDGGQGGNGAHGAREFADAMHVEEHSRVATAAALVDVDEPYLQVGQLRFALLLERVQPFGCLPQCQLRRRDSGVSRLLLFGRDITLDLEFPQIPKQCSRLRGETIRFSLKRADSFIDPPRHCIGGGAIGSLRMRRCEECGDDRCQSRADTAGPRWCHHTASIESPMRVVGFDIGEKRIGVAISDLTGTLARPLGVLRPSGLEIDALDIVASEIARLAREEDGVGAIVIGLPRRLDGSPTDLTPRVEQFARKLEITTALRVTLQDERLSSREAESRLAVRDKDWRSRKAKLDAAAAAVILQDYLDGRA